MPCSLHRTRLGRRRAPRGAPHAGRRQDRQIHEDETADNRIEVVLQLDLADVACDKRDLGNVQRVAPGRLRWLPIAGFRSTPTTRPVVTDELGGDEGDIARAAPRSSTFIPVLMPGFLERRLE